MTRPRRHLRRVTTGSGPAPFDEHLDDIAHAWLTAHAHGRAVGDHRHHQRTRRRDQPHHPRSTAPSPANSTRTGRVERRGRRVHVGDVIVTRRNDRQLHTSTGEPVRNRDYWTVNAITPDGGLAVTRIDGHGTVTLPADYVAEHVQLGYAATEPGNQSDTIDRSITLASAATTAKACTSVPPAAATRT